MVEINLWVLVDNYGRIYYSGSYDDCYKINFNGMIPNLKIINLKGEI
jgi:hypothetical protein